MFPRWEIPNVIESKTCLLPMVTQQSMMLMKLYKHYSNNILLKQGGILDQPNFYIEAMEILDQKVNENNVNSN